MLLLPLKLSSGIHWFSALGPVLWDLKNLEFQKEWTKVKLRGASGKKLKGMQASKLNKLMVASGEIYMMQPISQDANLKTGKFNDSDPALVKLLDSYITIFLGT